ncbi:MAG TPA: hypothetical protein PKV41_01825, partial [Candidatus Omnitrophota bacterium]|nr:hypothetical protein [Candidatus Omnitrophota bacterium]
VGYHGIGNEIIRKVNGREIDSFRDFVLEINKIKKDQKYIIFETQNKMPIILDNRDIDKVNEEILKRNNIPYQFSREIAGWLDGDSL